MSTLPLHCHRRAQRGVDMLPHFCQIWILLQRSRLLGKGRTEILSMSHVGVSSFSEEITKDERDNPL